MLVETPMRESWKVLKLKTKRYFRFITLRKVKKAMTSFETGSVVHGHDRGKVDLGMDSVHLLHRWDDRGILRQHYCVKVGQVSQTPIILRVQLLNVPFISIIIILSESTAFFSITSWHSPVL